MSEIETLIERLEIDNELKDYKWFIQKHGLKTKSRDLEVRTLRQYMMYRLRKDKYMSYPKIGKEFNKDHTTSIHAFNKIECYLEQKDKYLIQVIDKYNTDLIAINWNL